MSHAPSAALRRRHEAVRAASARAGVDALIVTSRSNIHYLTNFTGSSGIVVLTLFALVLDAAVGRLEKRLMKWQPRAGETEKL